MSAELDRLIKRDCGASLKLNRRNQAFDWRVGASRKRTEKYANQSIPDQFRPTFHLVTEVFIRTFYINPRYRGQKPPRTRQEILKQHSNPFLGFTWG